MDIQRLKARLRAFTIWQKLGYLPWSRKKVDKSKNGAFYKGAFDNIPFLNNDAKRTFAHLLLRPGYMIKDYIKGQHERYLAPLTSLIIFYAFFAMVSSIVNPEFSIEKKTERAEKRDVEVSMQEEPRDSMEVALNELQQKAQRKALSVASIFQLLDLDKHPELVDTPVKASLAAFESSLRSQGVYFFLGQFLFLWIAMSLLLRKRGLGGSACAAAAAYVLCQYCFFMFFSLFFSDKQGEIGLGLAGLLLTIDYHQLLGSGWKKSFFLTVKTGIIYVIALAVLAILLAGIVFIIV
jgi:hypothetical protein